MPKKVRLRKIRYNDEYIEIRKFLGLLYNALVDRLEKLERSRRVTNKDSSNIKSIRNIVWKLYRKKRDLTHNDVMTLAATCNQMGESYRSGENTNRRYKYDFQHWKAEVLGESLHAQMTVFMGYAQFIIHSSQVKPAIKDLRNRTNNQSINISAKNRLRLNVLKEELGEMSFLDNGYLHFEELILVESRFYVALNQKRGYADRVFGSSLGKMYRKLNADIAERLSFTLLNMISLVNLRLDSLQEGGSRKRAKGLRSFKRELQTI